MAFTRSQKPTAFGPGDARRYRDYIYLQQKPTIWRLIFTDTVNKSESHSDRLSEHYGYDLTICPALATPVYQIYSGYKIQGGIGDNLARSLGLWLPVYITLG